MNPKDHWEAIYRSKHPTEVSWYQATAALSLRLIGQTVPSRNAPIIDVGGGSSVLASRLYAAGYTDLTVLDLSGSALAEAKAAAGPGGEKIRWVESDILTAELPPGGFSFWHDRAVFHFLTRLSDREVYVAQARRTVRIGGYVLVAGFAEDGPTRCSGLEVVRYSPTLLSDQFGNGFALLSTEREEHRTPAGSVQVFNYCLFHRTPAVGFASS